MSDLNNYSEGDAYLQVRQDPRWPLKLKVVKATQRRPEVVDADCVVVKVRLRVPRAAFSPLEPEAVVTVPESLVQHTVDVEAVEA